MNGCKNKVIATSTTLQARAAIFQASQRPIFRKGEWIATSYGKARVTGRLGQRHADIVESIMYVAEKKRFIEDGGIEILVDPALVCKTISKRRYSKQRLMILLEEIMDSKIEIVTPELEKKGEKIIGRIIDHVIPTKKNTRYDPLTKGQRPLWKVRLGAVLVMLFEKDVNLYYDPSKISCMKSGIGQAVARFILTHKNSPNGGWHIDTILHAILGDDAKSQVIRNARRRLMHDVEQLKELNIIIKNGRAEREN